MCCNIYVAFNEVKIMCKNEKVQVQVRFSKEMIQKVDKLAVKKQSNRSQVIREATAIGLKHMGCVK